MEQSGILLIGVALILGLQHGFDFDHLSIIDSLTRIVRHNNTLSKMTGLLFSLGHGLMVTLVSLVIGSGLVELQSPVWLDHTGIWISTIFLFAFGVVTLWNVFKKSKVTISTFKARLLSKIITKNNQPFHIMFIGILFAFSFDTFSQIALFAISGSLVAGWLFSGLLGMVFMLGMMIADGLNGFIISTLIKRADKRSLVLSQAVGVLIAFFSLAIGTFNLIKLV